jgi:glycosyltransferase involved in cell wall biosynthesis
MPKEKPLVSVVVPALNEERHIAACVKSLLRQTAPRSQYEIIVSDSSSGDGTAKVAKKAGADRIVTCKRHSAGFGRNFGAKHARGELIGFVDGDSVAGETFVEGVISALRDKKGVAATGPIRSGDGKYGLFMRWWSFQDRLSIPLRKPIFPGFNFAARKKDFLSVGGMSEKDIVCEDIEVAWKLQKRGRVVWEPKMMVSTSTRRIQEKGIWRNVKNAWTFALSGKTESWKEHRGDF